jgi:ammonia channel protein AmtB
VHVNAGIAGLTAALLWVGWFGFNEGSALRRMAQPAWRCW